MSSAEGNDLEEALKEISREISSEFSCAREADPAVIQGLTSHYRSHRNKRQTARAAD